MEGHACKYTIRLKENAKLRQLAAVEDEALTRATRNNHVDYAVEYGEFMYKAGSWDVALRVCFKIEKPYGQFIHLYTFVVTTMEDLKPYQVIQYYCGKSNPIRQVSDIQALQQLSVQTGVLRSIRKHPATKSTSEVGITGNEL